MLRSRPATLGVLFLLAGSCTADEVQLPPSIPVPEDPSRPCDSSLGTLEQEIGEPATGGGQVFPNWQERVIYVLTNRARSDPAKQMAECVSGAYKACPWPEGVDGCYSPKPPLVWDLQTSRAARFHATYLSKAPCGLGHDTCCTLRADVDSSGCDGDPACACEAGTQSCDCNGACGNATGFGTRLSRFGASGAGEIAHQYYPDALDIFHGWVDEDLSPGSAASCSFTGKNGHRWLVLQSNGPRVGPGYFYKAGNCNSPYWVEDFSGGAATPSRVPGGVHYPQSGGATTDFRFWANYYHPGGGTPQLAQVVVGGACTPLSLEFGTAQNGTFRADKKLASGCQPYYFLFVDSDGARHTYPTTGSLQVAVGGTCPSDYTATQAPASCDTVRPDAGAPGPDAASPGPDAASPRRDAASPGVDAASLGHDAASPGPDASAPGRDAAAPGPDASSAGLDATIPRPDATTARPDAAAPGPDAAAAGADAAPLGFDAATAAPDAGQAGSDAAEQALDASSADGSAPPPDTGGTSFGPTDAVLAGCGCSSTGPGPAWWLLATFTLARAAWRRRR